MNLKPFKSGTDIRGFAAEEFSNEALYLSDDFICICVVAVTAHA